MCVHAGTPCTAMQVALQHKALCAWSTFHLCLGRYGVLLGAEDRTGTDDRVLSQRIVQSLGEGVLEVWQQGKSKVFLRESTERELEELRRRKLHVCAVIVQRVVSGVAGCVTEVE